MTDSQLGHHHDAHRCAGLGLNEPQLAADALERLAKVKLPRVQIGIRPSQPSNSSALLRLCCSRLMVAVVGWMMLGWAPAALAGRLALVYARLRERELSANG